MQLIYTKTFKIKSKWKFAKKRLEFPSDFNDELAKDLMKKLLEKDFDNRIAITQVRVMQPNKNSSFMIG
jgi:hypothetical protein